MTFIFETKQIDRNTNEKIARRYVWLMFGSEVWKSMNENWDIHIIPVEQSDKYRQMYGLTKWDTNPSIPWGFTQPPNIVSNELQRGRIFWFVNDTSNPFIIRQNAEKGNHEFAHDGCYIVFGNKRRTRKSRVTMRPARISGLGRGSLFQIKNRITRAPVKSKAAVMRLIDDSDKKRNNNR